MSFIPLKEVPTHSLRRAVIANAVGTGTYTIGLGTAIQPGATGHGSFVTVATSSNPILGTVVGLEYAGKITEFTTVVGLNAATTALGPGTDNETTGGAWKVIYIPSNIPVDFTADLSAAAGTTTDSAGFGWMNLISVTTGATGGATLDETSIAIFSGTQAQFWSNGASIAKSSSTTVAGVNQDLMIGMVSPTKKVTGHWSKVL